MWILPQIKIDNFYTQFKEKKKYQLCQEKEQEEVVTRNLPPVVPKLD